MEALFVMPEESVARQPFEETLPTVGTLALVIPLLMGTGGNAGALSATTVIRTMALEEVRWDHLGRVVWRELRLTTGPFVTTVHCVLTPPH